MKPRNFSTTERVGGDTAPWRRMKNESILQPQIRTRHLNQTDPPLSARRPASLRGMLGGHGPYNYRQRVVGSGCGRNDSSNRGRCRRLSDVDAGHPGHSAAL
jgi:hypothetical protein